MLNRCLAESPIVVMKRSGKLLVQADGAHQYASCQQSPNRMAQAVRALQNNGNDEDHKRVFDKNTQRHLSTSKVVRHEKRSDECQSISTD